MRLVLEVSRVLRNVSDTSCLCQVNGTPPGTQVVTPIVAWANGAMGYNGQIVRLSPVTSVTCGVLSGLTIHYGTGLLKQVINLPSMAWSLILITPGKLQCGR